MDFSDLLTFQITDENNYRAKLSLIIDFLSEEELIEEKKIAGANNGKNYGPNKAKKYLQDADEKIVPLLKDDIAEQYYSFFNSFDKSINRKIKPKEYIEVLNKTSDKYIFGSTAMYIYYNKVIKHSEKNNEHLSEIFNNFQPKDIDVLSFDRNLIPNHILKNRSIAISNSREILSKANYDDLKSKLSTLVENLKDYCKNLEKEEEKNESLRDANLALFHYHGKVDNILRLKNFIEIQRVGHIDTEMPEEEMVKKVLSEADFDFLRIVYDIQKDRFIFGDNFHESFLNLKTNYSPKHFNFTLDSNGKKVLTIHSLRRIKKYNERGFKIFMNGKLLTENDISEKIYESTKTSSGIRTFYYEIDAKNDEIYKLETYIIKKILFYGGGEIEKNMQAFIESVKYRSKRVKFENINSFSLHLLDFGKIYKYHPRNKDIIVERSNLRILLGKKFFKYAEEIEENNYLMVKKPAKQQESRVFGFRTEITNSSLTFESFLLQPVIIHMEDDENSASKRINKLLGLSNDDNHLTHAFSMYNSKRQTKNKNAEIDYFENLKKIVSSSIAGVSFNFRKQESRVSKRIADCLEKSTGQISYPFDFGGNVIIKKERETDTVNIRKIKNLMYNLIIFLSSILSDYSPIFSSDVIMFILDPQKHKNYSHLRVDIIRYENPINLGSIFEKLGVKVIHDIGERTSELFRMKMFNNVLTINVHYVLPSSYYCENIIEDNGPFLNFRNIFWSPKIGFGGVTKSALDDFDKKSSEYIPNARDFEYYQTDNGTYISRLNQKTRKVFSKYTSLGYKITYEKNWEPKLNLHFENMSLGEFSERNDNFA